MKPNERQALLLKIADLVEKNIEELALLDTLDMGAPISRTRNNRQRALGMLRYYAGMASSVASALGPVLGFALYHRYHFAGAFLGAAAMLLLSFVVSVPVTEPAKTQAPAQKPVHWLDNIIVKDTVAPAIGVAFLSFGHGGILTFLPIQALKLGLENPGLWFGVYAVCILASRPIAGPLSDKVSRQAVIIPGLILNLLGIIILAFSTSSTGLMAAAIIGGFGTGIVIGSGALECLFYGVGCEDAEDHRSPRAAPGLGYSASRLAGKNMAELFNKKQFDEAVRQFAADFC
jgi:MFS family permease